jgi:hypothetical protein
MHSLLLGSVRRTQHLVSFLLNSSRRRLTLDENAWHGGSEQTRLWWGLKHALRVRARFETRMNERIDNNSGCDCADGASQISRTSLSCPGVIGASGKIFQEIQAEREGVDVPQEYSKLGGPKNTRNPRREAVEEAPLSVVSI